MPFFLIYLLCMFIYFTHFVSISDRTFVILQLEFFLFPFFKHLTTLSAPFVHYFLRCWWWGTAPYNVTYVIQIFALYQSNRKTLENTNIIAVKVFTCVRNSSKIFVKEERITEFNISIRIWRNKRKEILSVFTRLSRKRDNFQGRNFIDLYYGKCCEFGIWRNLLS